jgi:cation transport ATPase
MNANKNLQVHQQIRQPRPLSNDAVEKIINVQWKELEIREREFEFRKQQDSNQLTYARESIKAEMDDRQNERNHNVYKIKLTFTFVSALILIVFGFMAMFSYWGKDHIASSIMTAISYAFTGIACFYLGRYKSK